MATETIELTGHIVDSLLLAKVLDTIVEAGVAYDLADVEIGRTNTDPSRARIELEGDQDELDRLIESLQLHGANRVTSGDLTLVAADRDGVLPAGFYSTTNLATDVLHRRRVGGGREPGDGLRPRRRRRAGSARSRCTGCGSATRSWSATAACGSTRPSKQRGASVFEFMNSEVSSEKPKALVVQQVADRIRAAHDAGGKVLAVCGPAVVHTGGAPDVARLIEGGWIDVLFAGNGFATHDIESNVLGTSLGVLLAEGTLTEGGHSNHLRVINEVRRYGSIAAAVEAGYVTGGAMATCVRKGVPFVLGGSIRDDGPLPDVYTDTAAAADAMRELIPGVSVALMLASTLHAIAVGNCLPAGVETFCVDINQAVVTKLADRGSHQAHGIVTDVGPFLGQLADALCGPRDGRARAGGGGT